MEEMRLSRIYRRHIMEKQVRELAIWLLENSEYYFQQAMEEAEELIAKGENPMEN